MFNNLYSTESTLENVLKDMERLVLLGLIKHSNDSEWVAPSFAQPKTKTNWVCLLSDFINLNRRIKCKPYTMPKINEILLKLKSFQYATPLDLNTGYDHIWLTEDASNSCTITITMGKYH